MVDDPVAHQHTHSYSPLKRPSPGILRIAALEPGLATGVRAFVAPRLRGGDTRLVYAARPMTTSLGLPSVVLPRAMTRK